MAALHNGKWSNEPIASVSSMGSFERQSSQFRETIRPTDVVDGRYHLYVSYACPWAHRTLIAHTLKKIKDLVPISVANAYMGEKGWTFASGHDLDYLADVYRGADAHYTGKVTVPVLWDNRHETIVNNESSEILRIFNSSFNHLTGSTIDLYPDELHPQIDKINEFIYENINNGVYRVGFAAKQAAYEEAFLSLFSALDEMDQRLGEMPFLAGEYFTEADIRLFTTLLRFDPVYYVHFKCNKKLIAQYPNLSKYLRAIYQIPEVKKTCHFDHIKEHYYKSHKFLNPQRIIPLGPEMDLEAPHGRGDVKFFSTSNREEWQH
jgi:glutathionyl-hydroquinone reductase